MASVPTTRPPLGFQLWTYTPPPWTLDRVEIWREGMTDTKVIDRHGDPAWNVFGVWWREPVERTETPMKWVQ